MATIPEALQVALQHHQAGRLEQAEVIYRQILQVQPQHPDALHLLGVLAHHVGQHEQAVRYIGQAIALDSRRPEFHNNLGEAYRATGKLAEAVTHYQRALALQPTYSDAHNNLGVTLQAQGHLDQAIAHYQRALALRSDYAEVHCNLGVALQAQGHLDQAIAHYQRALALRPALADAHHNFANALREQGRLADAMAFHRKALEFRPEYPEAYNNMGVIVLEQGRHQEASAYFRQALALRPTYAEALNNLGNVFKEQGKLAEAVACYRQALRLKPNCAEAENQLMHQLQHLCDWAELETLFARQKALLEEDPSAEIPPFTMMAIPSSSADQLRCAQNWVAKRLAAIARLRDGLEFRFHRGAKPRLKLGYLSADFRTHPVAMLIAELFELHNRSRVEVVAYSYGPEDGSDLRQRIIQACDRFVDLRTASFEEAAQRIYGDGVDILVDLTGYTKLARTEILALRPAPIQVNYLGYPGTMGAAFMDYIITDRFIFPPTHAPFYAEQLVYLPDCYQVNDRQRPIAEPTPTRAECGLPEQGIVFCCFNNSYKITPDVFTIWMRLLQRIPGSVLWLLEANPTVAGNLRREAQARGVEPARLVFAPRMSLAEHLARHRRADLFLDTLPVTAHTTGSDALWAGLPVLTCAGETFASRVAGSLLTAIGLPELITHSLAEYEARALHLAVHPNELGALRKRLAQNRLTAPLFDTPRFIRHLERAYELMWERYLRGEPPRCIEVPPPEA
jgi:predicted O-linked N-acetylglucosamine transferase (SPINDLY family)